MAPAEAQALPLLIVEDNDDVVAALELLFALHEIPALVARSPDAALACLAREPCGAVLQDMNFGRDLTSGREGAALFRAIRARYPGLPVILMTAWTSLEMAVALVKEGADDYLAKPWSDAALVARVRSALERGRAGAGGLEFASEAMRRLVDLALRVAAAGAPVLITGPNGSGKGRLAELLHEHSRRRGPLVRVDTGALPETLLEAELFGAEAGAYTGATRRREGLFEARFDPTQLRQVLLNLIKNAHESGGPPGEVSLRAFADEGGVAIEVADRGAGLSAEARELAFTPFFSTKPQGTGLGLSVSAEILEAHGGRLVLLAREGGGTIARCWLSREPSG